MKALVAVFGTLVFSLAFIIGSPKWAIKPGSLSAGHHQLNNDCFACHTPFKGATAEQCVSCHKLADIGRVTTTGVPRLSSGKLKTLFHQSLANTDCTGCHTAHTSARAKRETEKFKHDFLMVAARNDCASCHQQQKPADSMHQQVDNLCANCHRTTNWRVASFDHKQVQGAQTDCAACHQKNKPADSLHAQVGGDCAKCHSTGGWRPATFDHGSYFRLDHNHAASCNTCHVKANTFSEYTCYGCHEHTPAKIAAEHAEEGIRDLENCVRCHRSGSDDAERGREGGERLSPDAGAQPGKAKHERDDD